MSSPANQPSTALAAPSPAALTEPDAPAAAAAGTGADSGTGTVGTGVAPPGGGVDRNPDVLIGGQAERADSPNHGGSVLCRRPSKDGSGWCSDAAMAEAREVAVSALVLTAGMTGA